MMTDPLRISNTDEDDEARRRAIELYARRLREGKVHVKGLDESFRERLCGTWDHLPGYYGDRLVELLLRRDHGAVEQLVIQASIEAVEAFWDLITHDGDQRAAARAASHALFYLERFGT